MSPLPTVASTGGSRARRWDALILGSGAVALMAAARLGMAGRRVLVVEEAAQRDAFPGLREPFFLAGTRDHGVVDAALRALSVPLIDQRRIQSNELAFQVVADELRADVGAASLTARELATWGLLEPEEARALTDGLRDAAEAELQAMLGAPLVRPLRGGRLGQRAGRQRTDLSSKLRGLPTEASSASGRLAHFLECQVRALSNLADSPPSPEAKSRLLGGVLAGGASFRDGPPWLMGLLRRRVESSFGEFRTPPGNFQLVAAGQQPGLSFGEGAELWLGRALIIATPTTPLCQVLEQDPTPEFLLPRRNTRRRVAIHLKCPRALLPEGMGTSVLLTGDGQQAPKGPDPVSLSVFAQPDRPGNIDPVKDWVDLVARTVVDATANLELTELALEERVRGLLRFAGDDLVRCEVERPRWDDDSWLEDPASGRGWPSEISLRVSTRPPVYRLDRAEVAGLGIEGDLLLGWRAGDAIARELG